MQKPVAEVSVLYSAKSARLYVMKEKLQQHKKKNSVSREMASRQSQIGCVSLKQ
jgi:hypothetical protein